MTCASFHVFGQTQPQSPIVLSVPHSGRDYPDMDGLLRLPLKSLRALEDRYADQLAALAIAGGVSAIVSRMPRLWIDLNRAESDLDPAMVVGQLGGGTLITERMRGGLGLIPRRLGTIGDIWRASLTQEDVRRRIEQHYRPYHASLSAMLDRAHARFGVAMLVDLHSMPPLIGPDRAGIVLGDRYGATCAPYLRVLAGSIFADAGFVVGANEPYAGGHIIIRHTDRSKNIHALQVEVDRSLYLDEDFDRTNSSLPRLQETVATLIESLAAVLISPAEIAAE